MQERIAVSLKRVRTNTPATITFNECVLSLDAERIAKYTESLYEAANNLVRSIDKWKHVQPVNPQVHQDVELLRELL